MELEDEKGMGDLYDFKDIAVRGRNPPLKYLKARMPPGLPLGSPPRTLFGRLMGTIIADLLELECSFSGQSL